MNDTQFDVYGKSGEIVKLMRLNTTNRLNQDLEVLKFAIMYDYENHKDAVEYFKLGVDAYHEIKNGSGVVHCLTMQGANLLEIQEYQEAERVLETAVDIARQIEDNELLDDAIYYLARAKYFGEKYFGAQKLIEEAIEINSKIEEIIKENEQ